MSEQFAKWYENNVKEKMDTPRKAIFYCESAYKEAWNLQQEKINNLESRNKGLEAETKQLKKENQNIREHWDLTLEENKELTAKLQILEKYYETAANSCRNLEAKLQKAVECLRIISTDTNYNYQQEARRCLADVEKEEK